MQSRASFRTAHASQRRSGGGKPWASTVATMVRCTRSDPCARRRSARRRGALAVTAVALVCCITAPARAASSDRAIKACLLARMDPPPRLVVYGSSRAAKLEPSYLGSLLGTTVFNASVSSATAEDTWALAHLAHEQTGRRRREPSGWWTSNRCDRTASMQACSRSRRLHAPSRPRAVRFSRPLKWLAAELRRNAPSRRARLRSTLRMGSAHATSTTWRPPVDSRSAGGCGRRYGGDNH